MAKQNSSNIDLTPGGTATYTYPSASDTLLGRASVDTLTNKTLTAPVIASISNSGTITLPTGTDTLLGRGTTDTLTNKTITSSTNTVYDSRQTIVSLSSNATANATTTAAKITSLDLTVGAGTFKFEYLIRYQSSITTTGVKFSVNHTGTLTSFVANMRYVDVLATASSGAPTQAQNATAAGVMGSYSSRVKSATASMGPTLSTDAANSDMLIIIEGLMIVTASGDIQLYHASETAASTQVMAGTSLILTKLA